MDIDKVYIKTFTNGDTFVNKKVMQWRSIHEATQLNAKECDEWSFWL